MATPEEQKSQLLANRLQRRRALDEQVPQTPTTPSPVRQPAPAQPVTQAQSTPQSVNDIETRRKAALQYNRVVGGWRGEVERQRAEEEPNPDFSEYEADQENITATQRFQRGRALALVDRKLKQQLLAQQQEQNEEVVSEKTKKLRKEIKTRAKAGLRRGLIYVLDLVLGALDLSSWVSFIADVFIYIATLGWLNLEMIYGKYFAKGKSKFISPIAWDPIPMPIDKDAIILQAVIVAADLFFALALILFFAGGMCAYHDFIMFKNTPMEAGIAIAQGGQGMCLGAIISTVFGP